MFGGTMRDGVFYQARLQYIRDNAYLCEDESDAQAHHPGHLDGESLAGKFVLPPDYVNAVHYDPHQPGTNNNNNNNNNTFIPVALLASRDYCPFLTKAVTAESFGDAVQFLIVANNAADGEDVLVPMYAEYGTTRLILLSVTHRTGQALKRYIADAAPDVLAAGGPLIGFNNLPPEGILTVQDLQNYVLSALGVFFLFISFTGCVLVYVGRRTGQARLLFVEGPVGAVATTVNRVGRRLTAADIERLVARQHPSPGHTATALNHPSDHAENAADEALGAASLTTVASSTHDDNNEDCCAVCMEDFPADTADDGSLLTLPCGHLFHKDCVVSWLMERQSKCPLCKFDVYDYLSQLPADDNGTRTASSTAPVTSGGRWNPLSWLRYRSWMAVESGDGVIRHSGSEEEAATATSPYDEPDRQTVVIELA